MADQCGWGTKNWDDVVSIFTNIQCPTGRLNQGTNVSSVDSQQQTKTNFNSKKS